MPTERIAVIDLETTGLSPWRHDRVVEIAIVVMSSDGNVVTEYETLVNPNRDLGPTRIHQISAADVLHAPAFSDVAGDVIEVLRNVNAVAGHNISFDKNFLVKEFDRIGESFPDIPMMCTCSVFGRNNLTACCDELGLSFDGTPHRALSDARATAGIVSFLYADDPSIIDDHRLDNIPWPSIPALKTPCLSREHSRKAQDEPPKFLQRIASNIHHDVEALAPNVLAYMSLIDRVLEDRTIEESEEDALVEAALSSQLSTTQLEAAHVEYLHNLAVIALADGTVSDSERQDLHLVARLLGQDKSAVDSVLESAAAQIASAHPTSTQAESTLCGQRVCFTGELQSTINGQSITRDVAEALAAQAGLTVSSGVTKKLDLLVVADPNTQSGKAKKARNYGILVLSDVVFWRMAGVTID